MTKSRCRLLKLFVSSLRRFARVFPVSNKGRLIAMRLRHWLKPRRVVAAQESVEIGLATRYVEPANPPVSEVFRDGSPGSCLSPPPRELGMYR